MIKSEKYKTVTTVIKAICFLFLCALLVFGLTKIFLPYQPADTHRYEQFEDLPDNSIDVLNVGASTILKGVSPVRLWEKYGIVSENLAATSAMPMILSLNIKEALKTQSPKAVVIGVNCIYKTKSLDNPSIEGSLRKTMDYRSLSTDKIRTAADIAKNSKQTFISYMFPLVKYHTRWSELNTEEIKKVVTKEENRIHGQSPVWATSSVSKKYAVKRAMSTDKIPEYGELSLKYFKEIAKTCKENNIKLLLVHTPMASWSEGQHIGIEKYMKKYCAKGTKFLDFNKGDLINQAGIDFETDFVDPNHLNGWGAIKMTDYIGKYLIKYYDIPQYKCTKKIEKAMNEDVAYYHKILRKVQSRRVTN